MNWDAIGASAELLGALGVIASLLYLSSQIRHNNKLARRGAAQSLLSARGDLNRFISADPVLTALFWKGMDHPDQLSEPEQERFVLIMSSLVRHYEAIYLDRCEGLIPERVWRSQENATKDWMSRPGPQAFITKFEPSLDPEFVRFVATAHGEDAV